MGWGSTYYWRVLAWDGQYDAAGNGVFTASSTWSFTTADSPPSSPGLISPGSSASQSIDTSTTTFTAGASTDPDPGDTIQYRFQVATGADGQTGRLITSGWQSGTTWTPPAGTFQDGGIYYWTAQAQDNLGMNSPWSQPLKVRVDFRMGSDSRLPFDSEGPVSVNLSNGNALVTAGGPSFKTVGGPVGVSFDYNSMATQNYGLTGTYWQDPQGSGVFPPGANGQVQELTRQDTSLSFSWGSDGTGDGPDPGTVSPDNWEAVWHGYLTTLTTSDCYALVANKVDDNVTVTLGTQQVLTGNFLNQGPARVGSEFRGGNNLAITVDYLQNTGPEDLDIQIEDTGTYSPTTGCPSSLGNASPTEIPASWFTPTAPVLPEGWSRTGNSFAAGYTTLRSQSATSVAVVDESGSQHMFTSTGATGWTPPPGEDSTLTKNADGTWTLIGDDGYTYDFDANGELSSVTSPTDDAHRGAPTYNYASMPDTFTSRLTSIVDATGRTMTLQYWGEPGASCPTKAPYDGTSGYGPSSDDTYFLCKVSYADQTQSTPPLNIPGFGGGETDLYYTNGHLSRVTNPGTGSDGTPTTDFLYGQVKVTDPSNPTGYDTPWMMTGIRDQLTNDLIANGVITDPNNSDGSPNLSHFTQIAYLTDGSALVQSVTLPEPDSTGTNIPQHTYAYPSAGPAGGTTTVTVAGEPTPQGWARQVTYDAGGHATVDTGADGISTNYTWDDLDDRLVATIDHHYAADPTNGLETSSIYDAAGNVTDTYGPAPATSFTSNYTTSTPHATSTFDGGMSGLAGSWYEGANPTGTAAFHNTDTANDTWGTGSPSTPSSAIAPASSTSPFSGVLTGQATLSQAGKISVTADGAQVWVDDHQVLNNWGGPYAAAVNSDTPVDWWRLSDPPASTTAVDHTDSSPATYVGYPVSNGVPNVTKALAAHAGDGASSTNFNGSSQYVNIPSPSGSTNQAGFKWLGLSPFTIEAWIDPTGSAASEHYARIAVSEEAPGVKGVCGVCWSVSRLECSGARDAREPPLMPVEAVSGWEGRSRPACQGRP